MTVDPSFISSFGSILQDSQVDDLKLSKILVQIYYTDLIQLAQFLLDDESLAQDLVKDTLIQVILQRYCYLGEISFQGWLIGHMINVYKRGWRYKLDSETLIPFLNTRLHLPANDIDAALSMHQEDVLEYLPRESFTFTKPIPLAEIDADAFSAHII